MTSARTRAGPRTCRRISARPPGPPRRSSASSARSSILEARTPPKRGTVSDREPGPQSHVFGRVLNRDLPIAVRAEGVWIEDADGKRYLDAAGGAIVVNVGHGDRSLVEAMAEQASRTPYVH